MDPPGGFGVLRRKRHEEDPFVTFSVPDRKLTFDRLFEADSLEEFKASIQSRAKLGSDVRYDLIHTRDGDEVSIEDDQDFKAFAASTRYYHHSRVRVQITSGSTNFTSTVPMSVGGSVTAASDDNALEGGPPAKKRRIEGPKASIELSTTPAAPAPTTDAALAPAQEKPKPKRKPASKAAQVAKPPAADPPAPAPAGSGAPGGDPAAPAPAPAPKKPRKKADATAAKDTEAQAGVDEEPTPPAGTATTEGGETIKVGPPAKKPRKPTAKKAAPESTTNPPPPAVETQPAAPKGKSSSGNTKKAAPKTPATLPSESPSPAPEDVEDPESDTSNRNEPEKGSKKKQAPATARARSASSASNTSSVRPEDEAVAREAQPSKTKAAAKPKSTTAKKVDETGSKPKPKPRAKAPAKPPAAVQDDAAPDEEPAEEAPKKKRTAKPKSAAAGTEAAVTNDAAEAPAKPKAARAPKSKAAAPSEEQAPRPEADHAETSAKADQGAAKKRKKDVAHPEGDATASATANASTDAPAAKKPRKSTKPPTVPCRICLGDTPHNWFDCPTVLACITPPQNAKEKEVLDATLPQLEERLEELVEEEANDPKPETADLITSIETSIKMAKANQRGEPLVDEEEAPKKRRRTTSAKKKDGGDAAVAGEKEKGDGKKTSEVLPTFASTRVKENGPNAVPPSVSPTATATDLPVNPPGDSISANDDSPSGQTEEVGATEVLAGQGGAGKTKKGGTTEKAKKVAAPLPSKEAPERAKAPERVAPLPSTHVANETLMNSFTPVNSTNATLAPEPRWSPSPEPTSRPSKVGNVSTVASKNGGVKQKDTRRVQTTNDTTRSKPLPAPNQSVGQPLARPVKAPGAASSKTKKLSYMNAFSSSEEEEEEEEDSDGDLEMKNTTPKSASKTKSKAHTFLSPSPPPDLTPSRPKSSSSIASAPSVIRPRQETESEEEAPEINTRQIRTDGPPTIASSAKKPMLGAKLVAERQVSPLPRPPAKGNVRSEDVLVPESPRQDGSSSDESEEEEEEELPAQQPKKSGQEAAVKKGSLNATLAPQPIPKSVLPPNPSIARPVKLSRQDVTPKPQERRAASPVKSLQKDKRVESSDSETSSSSDSEDEKAVSDAIKKSTKGSNSSDSSNSSKDAPGVDVQRKPVAARPSVLQSASQTPAQRTYPSLQSLSSQPRRPVHRLNFLSQPRRPESSQARQPSDDSDESVDDSSDDDEVPKERRAGAGAQSVKKKAGRLQAWV